MNQLEQTLEGSEEALAIDAGFYEPPRVECIIENESKVRKLLKGAYEFTREYGLMLPAATGAVTGVAIPLWLVQESPKIQEFIQHGPIKGVLEGIAILAVELAFFLGGFAAGAFAGTKLVDKIDTYLHKNNLFPYSEGQ